MNQKKSVSLEEHYYQLPGLVGAKDRKGTFLFRNDVDDLSAADDGTNKGKKMVGKSDKDFPWKASNSQLLKNDTEVMEREETITFLEQGELHDGKVHTFVSTKSPLRNEKGKIVGVSVISLEITPEIFNQLKEVFYEKL